VLQAAGWRWGALATALNRATFPAEVPPPVRMGGRAGEALVAALGDPQRIVGAQTPAASEA
jgi:extradiol dioxygenase family protein